MQSDTWLSMWRTFWPIGLVIAFLELLYVCGVANVCVRAWRKEEVSAVRLDFFVLCWGIFWPMFLLFLATYAWLPKYQGSKGEHWIHYANDDWAGMTIWPVFLAASLILADGVSDLKSHPWQPLSPLLAGVTLAIISGWYAYATAFLDAAGDELTEGAGFALFPALACVNYVVLTLLAWCVSGPRGNTLLQAGGWLCALGVSFAVKYPIISHMLSKLPEEVPPGYRDCFVVTAAARGHPGIVGSWVNGEGRRVNEQLRRLKGFEYLLKERAPRVHRGLRAVYNRVGPWVARRIRFRVQADAVYVLLKPAEWLAWAVVRNVGTRSRAGDGALCMSPDFGTALFPCPHLSGKERSHQGVED